jgi:hypothetical protein
MVFSKYTKALILALILKAFLFIFAEINAPHSKIEYDSKMYLNSAQCLAVEGKFAHGPNCETFVIFRTPGYSLFLNLTHHLFHLSYRWIIFLQLVLGVLSSFILYKTVELINPKWSFLSVVILLFDPPITIYALQLMTESLFLFFICIFMYTFVRFLKDYKMKWLIFSALALVSTVYIRPVSYYLPIGICGIFLLHFFPKQWKKGVLVTLIFLSLSYSLIGLWHVRNEQRRGHFTFSSINNATIKIHSLIGSFERLKEWKKTDETNAVVFYFKQTTSSFMSLFFRPGTLKYLESKPLKIAGKIFSFPWMTFWGIGFFVGLKSIRKNPYIQFMALVILYFTVVTIVAISYGTSARFRVPMMPFIAVISACGWSHIGDFLQNRKIRKSEKE